MGLTSILSVTRHGGNHCNGRNHLAGIRNRHWGRCMPGITTCLDAAPDTPAQNAPVDEAGHSILLPILGAEYPERAISFGLALAQKLHKPLHIVAYIEVPRTQSLESNHEIEVAAACDRMEQARKQGVRLGLPVWVSATKVRSYTAGIIETVQEIYAGLVVLAPPQAWNAPNAPSLSEQADVIREKAACAVLLMPDPQGAHLHSVVVAHHG